ncbi:MAG: hypothetical protein JXA15_11830 [Spirochaetales bacterium]|nr:hypothetical protein [Spirochaetales bacterium]
MRTKTFRQTTPVVQLALFLLLGFVLVSCATGSGSAYSSSVSGDESAAARAAAANRADDDDDDDSGGWSWDSDDSDDSDSSTVIVIEAPKPSCTVYVTGLAPGAGVFVNGSWLGKADSAGFASGKTEAGLARVEASLFGHEDWDAVVELPSWGSVTLQAYMPARPFGLAPRLAAAPRFDPGQPGLGGTARIVFEASARGSWRASVRDEDGDVVRLLGTGAVGEWPVTLSWDGRDDSGNQLAEGRYVALVEGEGQDGRHSSIELPVRIERAGVPVRASTLHGGFGGAMLAPDATVLPDLRFQTAAGLYAFVDSDLSSGEDFATRAPAWAGFRAGGLFGGLAELALSVMGVPYFGSTATVSPSSVSVAGSFKTGLVDTGAFAAALLVSGAWGSFTDPDAAGWPAAWDGPARFPGLGATFVAEARAGRSRLFASAEGHASTFYPGYDDMAWDVPGFFAWAYLRAGAEALVPLGAAGDLTLAASAAVRTEPLGGGAGFRDPLSVAAELAWYVPDSPVVISALGAGEWRGFNSWYFAGGLAAAFAW